MTTTNKIELIEILHKNYLFVDEDGAKLRLDNPNTSNLNIDISLNVNPENFNCDVWNGEVKIIFTSDELDNIYDFLLDAYNENQEEDKKFESVFDSEFYKETVQLYI